MAAARARGPAQRIASARLLPWLFFGGLAFAQQATPPTFRTGTTLVPVTVRVVDRDGRPVTDLTAEDFTVFENTSPRRVSLFAVQAYAGDARAGGLRVRTAADDLTTQQRRIFVIIFGRGDSDGPVHGVDGAIHLVRDLLRPQDLVSVVAWNRATPFTAGHARVAAFLERFKSSRETIEGVLNGLNRIFRPAPGPGQIPGARPAPNRPDDLDPPLPVERADMPSMEIPWASLDAAQARVDAVFRDFGPSPRSTQSVQPVAARMRGRGPIEDAGDPASMSLDEFMALRRATQRGDFGSDIGNLMVAITYLRYFEGEKHVILLSETGLALPAAEDDLWLARLAASANVIVDYVHTGGAMLLNWTLNTARTLAEVTGGRAYLFQMPTTAAAMDEVDRTTRREYILGYYVPKDDRAGARQIEVRVNRPGLTLLYRRDYVPEGVLPPIDRERTVREGRIATAAARLEPFTDIAIRATAAASKPPARPQVRIDMRIDPSRLAFERDDRGRNISNFTLVGFCVDAREQLVGRFSNAMRLTLNDDRLAAVKRDGIAASADVPVTGHAVRVKIVAYDDATDSLGSVIAAVK